MTNSIISVNLDLSSLMLPSPTRRSSAKGCGPTVAYLINKRLLNSYNI
ncbi:MAG: hypothetical protein LBB88_01320 [Planctomycetaceae bacterium]|nr:hypothetical protein [Planctomycetaceae bacterium]